jgi:hypothetical protein
MDNKFLLSRSFFLFLLKITKYLSRKKKKRLGPTYAVLFGKMKSYLILSKDIIGSSLMLPPSPTTQFPSPSPNLSPAFVKYFMQAQGVGVKFVKGLLLENLTKIQQIYLQDSDNRVCRYTCLTTILLLLFFFRLR